MCSEVGVGVPDLVEAYAYCACATCPYFGQNRMTGWEIG